MIGKAMQAITAMVVPLAGAGCILSAASHQLLSSGAPASSPVALLSCEPDAATGLDLCDHIGHDGCPVPTALNRTEYESCEVQKAIQSQITSPGGPTFGPKRGPVEPEPHPLEPGEIVPRIVEGPK